MNLLSKSEISEVQKFFSLYKIFFCFSFFFLIPVKTFKEDHIEPVFNLTWFFKFIKG